MKRLLLIAGHGTAPNGNYDPGACSSWGKEAQMTRELATKIYDRVKDALDVTMYNQARDCYAYSKAGDAPDYTEYDYVLEIHFNAKTNKDINGDGRFTGTGGYIHPNDGCRDIAEAIVGAIVGLGFKLWLIDTSTGLLNLSRARNAGTGYFLLETAFIDDGDDMKWYKDRKDEVAGAVASALIGYLGDNKEPDTDEVWMGWTVRETGSAGLRCIHGDAGKAYGLQFDYRYGLVPFMQYCVKYNPKRYEGFNYFIQLGVANQALVYNEALGKLWQQLYDKYTEEFSTLQITCAYNSYYEEAKRYMSRLYGIDMDKRHPAVKGTLFSMAFRSGALSGAQKFSGCTAKTSDSKMLDIAYAAYGNEDGGRWTLQNQWGDARSALATNDSTVIYKTMPETIEEPVKEPVESFKDPYPYKVQVGFYNTISGANNAAMEFKQAGFHVIVAPKGKGYMIQDNAYKTKSNAQKRVKALKNMDFIIKKGITPFWWKKK